MVLMLAVSATLRAQTPTYLPMAEFTLPDGSQGEGYAIHGSGPISGKFYANLSDYDGWTPIVQWEFVKEGQTDAYLVRYEENTEYTFAEFGKTYIYCTVKFVQGTDTIAYMREDFKDMVGEMSVSVAESKLEMPNAFSPNGDGINDIYKAKDNYQSIVEFHATIFNRYGQKLYEWDDPTEGWDGTYRGNNVKDGVYYVQVKAKGADGVKYNIRRDVNLLRGYKEKEHGEQE